MSKVKHWGEIEESEEAYIPDVSADVERSMNKFSLAEFDAECEYEKNELLTLQTLDPLILHAIKLHKHASDMTGMIRLAELAIESNLIPSEDVIPPIPETPCTTPRHVRNSLNYLPKQFTAFSLGKEINVPEIGHSGAKFVLTKCIAAMTAHIGYETTHQSVLNLLTDVLEEFLFKIAERVKIAQEDQQLGRLCGFPNVIERVLTETGMGGVKGLHEYYQNRVVKYIGVLQKRCQELNDRYAKLLIPRSGSPIDKLNTIIRVKVEQEDNSDIENSEMHFPDGEASFSSLETGYQLLNSLEAETTLQSLAECEEDITVNASPNVVSIPETDIATSVTNMSPYATRKKRR